MANPFLVLGGIAIGVITAAFGVLSVPGWVASAQDAAAQNDLGNAVLAQNASVTRTGAGIGTVAGLTDANGMKFGRTDGVGLETYANGRNWGLISTSQSGRVFARVSTTPSSEPLTAPTRAALLADPAFTEAWAEAGLAQPAAGDPDGDGEEAQPGVRYLHRYQQGSEIWSNVVVARSGENFGTVVVGMVDDPATGSRRVGISASVNNGLLLAQQITTDNADLVRTWNTVASRWAAAGLDPVNLSNAFAPWADAEKIGYEESTDPRSDSEVARFTIEYAQILPNFLRAGAIPTEPVSEMGTTYRAARTAGAGMGALMTTASGYTFSVLTADDRQWKLYSAPSAEELLNDPAFKRAATAAGLAF